MDLDEIETACEKFLIDLNDLEDRLLHVVINDDDNDLIDILLNGGPQCQSCGSWKVCDKDDPDAVEAMDGTWCKQTRYTVTGHWTIACDGCGKRYNILRDEVKSDH